MTPHIGYVITDRHEWYVHGPIADRWGLIDEEEAYVDGWPVARQWVAVPDDQVPHDVRARLGWILMEVRS